METRVIRVADRGYVKPIPSFTDHLAGLTKGSFGQTGDEIQEWLNREREERWKRAISSDFLVSFDL